MVELQQTIAYDTRTSITGYRLGMVELQLVVLCLSTKGDVTSYRLGMVELQRVDCRRTL